VQAVQLVVVIEHLKQILAQASHVLVELLATVVSGVHDVTQVLFYI